MFRVDSCILRIIWQWLPPQTVLFSAAKNSSRWIWLVRQVRWQVAVVAEYLFTSVVRTVSRRIYNNSTANVGTWKFYRQMALNSPSLSSVSVTMVSGKTTLYESPSLRDISSITLSAANRTWTKTTLCHRLRWARLVLGWVNHLATYNQIVSDSCRFRIMYNDNYNTDMISITLQK